MADGVSVIICCHNSAGRLPETLRHLAAQRVPAGIGWEVIVVDNASTDESGRVALNLWPASGPAPLRVVFEPNPGLSNARVRGIQEAQFGIVSFIDDDNWVASDWVERVSAIFARQPRLGACGGKIEAVCETPPTPWFAAIQQYYAIGRQYPASGDITETAGTLLCGAGLSVRTASVRALLADGFHFRMNDRNGKLLSSGGDTELCFALRAAGWRFWYDDELMLRHFIPASRLQWAYAMRLLRGIGESSPLIALYLVALDGPPFNVYPNWKKGWGFQVAKAFWHLTRFVLLHPRTSLAPCEGSVAVLELEMLKGRLAAWWGQRDQFRKARDEIRHSAWAKKAPRF